MATAIEKHSMKLWPNIKGVLVTANWLPYKNVNIYDGNMTVFTSHNNHDLTQIYWPKSSDEPPT